MTLGKPFVINTLPDEEALLKQNGADLGRKKALTAGSVFAIKYDFAAQLFATE